MIRIQLTNEEKDRIVQEHQMQCKPFLDELTRIVSLKTPKMIMNLDSGEFTMDYGPETETEVYIKQQLRELNEMCHRRLSGTPTHPHV